MKLSEQLFDLASDCLDDPLRVIGARVAGLEDALEQIAKGEGAYSRIPLKHASNVINNMMHIANKAIRKATE